MRYLYEDVDNDKVTFVEYLIRAMDKYESMGKQKAVRVTGGPGGPWPAVSIITGIGYR